MKRLVLSLLFVAMSVSVFAQHEHGNHNHGDTTSQKPVERPRVFLDKSPRVVAYQLKRLNNKRLLLVERKTDDPKYAPVYKAILVRAGMSPQYREESLQALVELNQSNAADEIISAIETLDPDDPQQRRSATKLAEILLSEDEAELAKASASFVSATKSKNEIVRSLGYAGLISTQQGAEARKLAKDEAGLVALMNAIRLVRSETNRNAMRSEATSLVGDDALAVRTAAIRSLKFVSSNQSDTFTQLGALMDDVQLRTPAVRTLLTIPAKQRDPDTAAKVVKTLVELAENTPAAERTTDEFTDAMQLADQLFARIPVNMAREYRARLREVTVRVVKIHTIEEEMRYDVPYFAVEAGRPVQVVLVNEDLMPHNLVIATPGDLQEVAELGFAAGPNGGMDGKQYVPKTDKVLYATQMVPPAKSERLTFTAPTEPGQYPYVCTFPRHWMRMYGVMLVVEDLAAWQQNPVAPPDPLGSTRSFVQNWKVDDFKDQLPDALANHSADQGKPVFTEATCAQCHKANGQGGAVGPELNGLFARWKNDTHAILREILDPSHRIDPKYAVHLVVTEDGETISGIVTAEDKKSVTLMVNPESKETEVVKRSEIEEMVKTSTSMMPKGLLDRFQKEEVLDLLAYLQTLAAE